MKRILLAAAALLAAATSLMAQSSKLVSFYANTASFKVAYYCADAGLAPNVADVYTINDAGIATLLQPSTVRIDGPRTIIEFKGLSYRNSHKYGNEFRIFLPLNQSVSALSVYDQNNNYIALAPEYPDTPIAIKGLDLLGSTDVRPAEAPVNKLCMIFDTKIIDATKESAKGSLITYKVKKDQTIEDVVKDIRTKLGLNQSELFPSVRQRRDRRLYEWNDRHALILARNKATNPQIALIGDSITHYWGDQAGCFLDCGREYFDELFSGWRTTDLGYGWDRLENMMWRLDHGEMDGYKAEHIFVMAGTNNINNKLTDAQLSNIAKGTVELIQYIRRKQPKAIIHVVKVYPRRNTEARINKVNDEVVAAVSSMPGIDIIDTAPVLAGPDGKIIESLFADGTHPNAEGYKLIAEVYKQHLNSK